MIVITKIEVLKTNKDFCEIVLLCQDPFVNYIKFEEGNAVDIKTVREYIKGRRFYNPRRGIDVVLGVSKEVGDILGLQYEAFENLEKGVEHLRIEKNGYYQELKRIGKFNFWKRLKCLFFGIKTSCVV